MKVVDELFDMTQLVQIVCTVMFFVFNYQNLGNIVYHLQLDPHTDVFGRTVYTYDLLFSINYYFILLLAAVIFLLLILASLNIIGSGLSDTGSVLLSRFLAYIVMYIVMLPAALYYLSALSSIVAILFLVIISFALILKLSASNADTNTRI